MNSPITPTEPTPIIEILRRFYEKGKILSANLQLRRGGLQLWSSTVRSQLAKIYGKNAQQLDYFPRVTEELPQELVHQTLNKRMEQLLRIIEVLDTLLKVTDSPISGNRIFIGHGRSPLWRELKDFLSDKLQLPWDEFNREAVAGYTTSERLDAMMSQAAFAFLVMTAEDERTDATLHARPNVIHEIGLFQGRLGLPRAIVLLEEGCSEFSNINGLSQIRFPRGDIAARFEDVRSVLEREGFI